MALTRRHAGKSGFVDQMDRCLFWVLSYGTELTNGFQHTVIDLLNNRVLARKMMLDVVSDIWIAHVFSLRLRCMESARLALPTAPLPTSCRADRFLFRDLSNPFIPAYDQLAHMHRRLFKIPGARWQHLPPCHPLSKDFDRFQ